MKPLAHAERSVKKYGGSVEDFLPIHDFLDSTKASLGDVRHRAILHNAFGAFLCEKIFGTYIEIQKDYSKPDAGIVRVSVRDIAEDHIVEDCGFLPSIQDWLAELPIKDWMAGKGMNERISITHPSGSSYVIEPGLMSFDGGDWQKPMLFK